MKKLNIVLLFTYMLGMFVSSSNKLLCSCDSLSGCTSGSSTFTYYDHQSSNCDIQAEFTWKKCGAGCATGQQPCKIEMHLTNFTWSGNGCNSVSWNTKLSRAIRIGIWNASSLTTPPLSGSFELIMHIYACWDGDGINCNQQCCTGIYTVDVSDGYVQLTDKERTWYLYNCSQPSFECENHCDELDLPLETNIYPDMAVGLGLICGDTTCQSEWQNLPTSYVTGTVSSIDYVAYYGYRECLYKEVFIYKLTLSSSCPNETTQGNIYNDALKKCLALFGPTGNGNRDTIVVKTPMCWRCTDFGGYTITPCNSSNCCPHTYVLINDNGDIECESFTPPSEPSGNCNLDGCYWTCDNTSVPLNTPLPKRPDTDNFNFGKIIYPELKIIPNPTTGLTEIHFTSSVSGELILKVYDNIGTLVQEVGIMKSNNTATWYIETESLTGGIYYLSVIKDDIKLTSGTFIVKK